MSETILGQKRDSYSGDIVLDNQELATKQGFGHVSKIWYKECLTYDQGMDKVLDDQKKIEDFKETPLRDWSAQVNADGRCVLQYKDGRQFDPTEHAWNHLGTAAGVSTYFLRSFAEPKVHATKKNKLTGEPVVEYNRDVRDGELVKHTLDITLFAADRTDQNKPRLIRTWNDGTMRALLSDQYAIVNNAWVLESLRSLIPGGMLSHWRGDADNIYGNILIPDTIRAERDSDYGGMLSVGNSEIGLRRISSCPSVFRAICMNGCIWNQEKGDKINQKHRGVINLEALYAQLKGNLESQIPLLNEGIERTLGLRAFGCDGVDILKVMAEVGQNFKITPKQMKGVLQSFATETEILDKEAYSAFGVQAAITRFGQTLDNEGWVKFDEIGGMLSSYSQDRWNTIVKRAKELDPKVVEKALGIAA